MKSRITVTGIFNLQLNRRIFSSDKDLTISCCFSNSELMLLGINNRGIIAYRLPNFDILAEYPLQQKVTKIVQHKAYFFVVCADRPTILCLEWSDNKLTLNNQLEGHLLPVNSISITNQEEPVSCSDDFTLRLWQSEQPFLVTKILAGHKGKVTSVDKYRDYIVSGSSEKEILVWHNRKQHERITTLAPVEAILVCVQAGYLAVATRGFQLEMYDLKQLKQKNMPMIYAVKIPNEPGSMSRTHKKLVQLDQHFITLTTEKSINFVEIYMGELIRLMQTTCPTVDIIPINSLVIFADGLHICLEELST